MPAAFLVQVALPSSTNIPADDVVNTFVFADVDQEIDAVDLIALFGDFYNGETAPFDSISYFLSPTISRERPATIDLYNLADPEPRQPLVTTEFSLGEQGSDTAMPDEVALCLSYRGTTPSGASAARRRGRVFIGPFNALAMSGTESPFAAPTEAVQRSIMAAGTRLWEATAGTWYVWSRVDDEIYPLNTLWVDDAWDSQRRRGRRATSRIQTTLSL